MAAAPRPDAASPIVRVFEPGHGRPVPLDIGGKARGLMAIADAGLSTPPWFAVLPGAIRSDGTLDEAARAAVAGALDRLGATGPDRRVAIRSSARDEDGVGRSFAGQYLSVLPVTGLDAVVEAIGRCVRWSGDGGLEAYRRAGGSVEPDAVPALIVQRYVEPRSAGVAFSRDPLTGDSEVIIAAAPEPGAITAGDVPGDEYRVLSDLRVIVARAGATEHGSGDPTVEPGLVPVERVLSDEEAVAVAGAALLLELRLGAPQDVEWAFDAMGALVVLQTRPITAPWSRDGGASDVILWDDANIVESFPELTLPLTFSVAVELYASVYRGACRALGVPAGTTEREGRTFEQMLGLLQGRVYYDLNSWYRVLSLLPGFRHTAGFLESMMGARRPGTGPDERAVLAVAGAARRRELAAMSIRLAYRWLRFGDDATGFRARIDALLAEHRGDASGGRGRPFGASGVTGAAAPTVPPAVLLAEFDRLRASTLRDWRAPIHNDLFLMLAHGALRRVATRWLGPDAPNIVNGLLAGAGVASARPGDAIRTIAAEIRGRPDWNELVTGVSPDDLASRLATDPALAGLAGRIAAYLDAWGDRSPRELQLDRPSYRDDPISLLRALQPLVASALDSRGSVPTNPDTGRLVRRRLLQGPLGPIRLATFSVLLRATRRHIRWREEMRLARGQVFGIGRTVFRDLGRALTGLGLLERPDDIHYLTVGELRGLVSGTAAPGHPRDLVRLRRARYAEYATLPRLPSRLETRGPITDPLTFVSAIPGTAPDPGLGRWQGIGASVGRVRAACLVVTDPMSVGPESGRIIVARSTDPGWVPLLIGAAGLAVERGGLLSHSAIVARELGIPTVVGLRGIVDAVRDGDLLELDGATGEVRRMVTDHGGVTEVADPAERAST